MKESLLLTVFLALLLVSTALAQEPGDTLWTRTYGGYGEGIGTCVQQTSDGGYMVGGFTHSFGAGGADVYLVKTDANGDTLWTRTYGGRDDDKCLSCQQTTDGGYILVGGTASYPVSHVYLVKADANGDSLWTRTYAGSSYNYGSCVQETNDGGYIIAGKTGVFGLDTDVYLVKTDADGDTLWTRTYGGAWQDEGWSVRQTTDGGYIITGYTTSFGAGDEDVWLLKTDAKGDTVWTRTYGGGLYDRGNSVQQTTDGGYVIAGGTVSFGGGNVDVWLLKTDSNGDTLWTRTYPGGGPDTYERGFSVQQTTDGGYIMAGMWKSYVGQYNWFDVYLVRADVNGDTLWTRTYGGEDHNDYAFCVQQTTDGGYIVTGYTASFGAGGSDAWLLKIAGEALLDISIEIIPDDPPVTVPQGGSFGFAGNLTNNTGQPQTTDIWVMVNVPGQGMYGPLRRFNDVGLSPYDTLTGHFNQRVPNFAPLGVYDYIAYCGDYPSAVVDSSFFQVEVFPGVLTKLGEAGWVLTGSFLEGEDFADLPSEFALIGNYPNPFNAETEIAFEIPVASDVTIQVYDILGRKVETLIEGYLEAGSHTVTWDASTFSSGIYFHKLSASDLVTTRIMNLLK